MSTRTCLGLGVVILLGACSTASTIQQAESSKSKFGGDPEVIDPAPIGADQYRVYHRAATGFVSLQSIRGTAEQRAVAFCKNKGQGMQVVTEQTSKPPYILGNFPRLEIVFACTDMLAAVQPAQADPQYTKLVDLKKLLDAGILTEEEFNAEKRKILSQ